MRMNTPIMRRNGIQFRLRLLHNKVGGGLVRYSITATCLLHPFAFPHHNRLQTYALMTGLTGYTEELRQKYWRRKKAHQRRLIFTTASYVSAEARVMFLALVALHSNPE